MKEKFCVWLCGFDFACFFLFSKITRHSNNFKFSKLQITNSEASFFPAIFEIVVKM